MAAVPPAQQPPAQQPLGMDPTAANLYYLQQAMNIMRGPGPGQGPPGQQPAQTAPSAMGYGLPTTVQTPNSAEEAHNLTALYAREQQLVYGHDPVETDGPPSCFGRDRRVACGVVFNMNSYKPVQIVGHLANALGVASVLLTIAFEMIWIYNGTGENEINLRWLMAGRNEQVNWWVPFPGIFGYLLLGVAHVLYLIGGSIIPMVFVLVCDLAGMAAGFMIMFAATNATNRMIGLALTFGALPLVTMILFIILAARDPRYVQPPSQMQLAGGFLGTNAMTPQEAAGAPRLAGIPIYPTSGPYGQTAAIWGGYPMQPMRTGGKGKKHKSRA